MVLTKHFSFDYLVIQLEILSGTNVHPVNAKYYSYLQLPEHFQYLDTMPYLLGRPKKMRLSETKQVTFCKLSSGYNVAPFNQFAKQYSEFYCLI